MPSAARPSTFKGIQALRGIAAVVVIVDHATLFSSRITSMNPAGDPSRYWENGAAGVDIFFVISGFVMAVSSIGKDHGPHPARTFLEKRVLRIFPMYWVVSLMFLAEFLLFIPFPQWKTHGEVFQQLTPAYIVSSLLLIPRSYIPMVGVAWTLIYECFFYLLFTMALAARVGLVRFLTLTIGSLVLLGIVHYNDSPAYFVCTHPLLLEFLAGVYVGKAILDGHRLRPRLAALLGGLGFLLLLLPQRQLISWHPLFFNNLAFNRILIWGVPAVLIVLSTASLEERFGRLWPRFMLLVGDASYSLYLSHVLCLSIVARIFEATGVLSPGPFRLRDAVLMAATCLIVSIAFSLLLYRGIEQPLQQLLRRRLVPRERPPAQAAA